MCVAGENRVLVLYGTTDGQVGKIAGAIAETLRHDGADVDLMNAAGPGVDPAPEDYSAVVVAASVHAGGYQRPVLRWVSAHAESLKSRPNAFVSVCLGVLEKNPKTDASLLGIAKRFFSMSNWEPRVFKIVAGALPYTKYNWLKRWTMRRIVAKVSKDIDTRRDYEYTDWEDLKAFTHAFSQQARG
jgi:menaquinone-dependent protoporphyrinogen oxidase